MTGRAYEELAELNRKLDDLLTRYSALKSENMSLKGVIGGLEKDLEERLLRIKELESRNEKLKLTGALLGDGENAAEAKKKINELVREIDRCVALLNR